MTKLSAQKSLIQSGVAVLVVTPFAAYFGSKAAIAGTCDSEAVWSMCQLGEVPTALFIALGLCFVAAMLFTAAVLRKS
jgi:hypothetical protein